MHGIPSEYLNDYISAWREDFEGVELSWLQIEVCRLAMEAKSINDILAEMRNKYAVASNLAKSSAYRMVDNLIKEGYVGEVEKDEGSDKRSRIIQTLPKGARELGQLGRYFFEIQSDRMKTEFWGFIIEKINAQIGCLLEHQVAFIGPDLTLVSAFVSSCKECDTFTNYSKKKQERIFETAKNPYFVRIGGASLKGSRKGINIQEEEIDNWVLKDNLVDIIIEIGAVGLFSDKGILTEATRILKPGGWIVLLEFTEATSTFVLRMMREIAYLSALQSTGEIDNLWSTEFDLPTINELVDKIRETKKFIEPIVISDAITTIVLAQKLEK
ncbi:MAG: hypothetical protein ACXAD7_25575 [Candidatus Kariarchaeaceae archaeon]|jgi:DNA-binding MarR family transcriptional regulator